MAADMEMTIKENCFGARETLKTLKEEVLKLMDHPVFVKELASSKMYREMKANIMLTYRHLEDARMRLGKVVQAVDGGTSVYPK